MKLKITKEERKELIERISKLSEEELQAIVSNEVIITTDFHIISLKNTAIALAQRDKLSVLGGYSQWRSVGRQVKKGESAVWITAPIFEKDKETIKGFIEIPMFDWSQTDPVSDEI